MICVSVISEQDLNRAFELGDAVELRADLGEFDIEQVLANKKKPVIVTDRKNPEALKKAILHGADYVDVDIEFGPDVVMDLIEHKKKTKIILSYHNFEETPEDLYMIYDNLVMFDTDVVKIATTANNLSDNLRIFDLIRRSDNEIIAFCMGEFGEISRILSPMFGGLLTFGCVEGKQAAPGQIDAAELRDVYRVNSLNEDTRIFGVIGNPVKYSKGRIMHNLEFKHAGLNSVYLPFLTEDIEDTMRAIQELDAKGCSVTMPCKQAIMNFLDEVDPVAAKIGAVNTVVNKNSVLIGYNADMVGAVKALEAVTEISGKNVVVLGAGGAARAVAYGVKQKGGKVTILNRTVAKAKQLAEEFKCSYGGLDKLGSSKIDILINTTSVGMAPNADESLVDKELLKEMIVMDAVYSPKMTKLLKDAQQNGCKIISGIEMYLHQAAEQFRLWTGMEAQMEFMREQVMKLD